MRFTLAGSSMLFAVELFPRARVHDSIGIFEVENSGQLNQVGEEWTRTDYPRRIDPTGKFLVSCNQRSDALTFPRSQRQQRFGRTSRTRIVGSSKRSPWATKWIESAFSGRRAE